MQHQADCTYNIWTFLYILADLFVHSSGTFHFSYTFCGVDLLFYNSGQAFGGPCFNMSGVIIIRIYKNNIYIYVE